jgi:hypothetical protein
LLALSKSRGEHALCLERQQQRQRLQTVITSIYKVALSNPGTLALVCSQPTGDAYHEDIARPRTVAADSEQFEEVPELAVDVAADGDGGRNRLDVRLLHEQSPDDLTKMLHRGFGQMAALSQLGDVQVGVEVALQGEWVSDDAKKRKKEERATICLLKGAGEARREDARWAARIVGGVSLECRGSNKGGLARAEAQASFTGLGSCRYGGVFRIEIVVA